jgi:UDP-glucose 4-epimerase
MIKNKTEQKIMVTGAKGYIGRNFINKYGNEYHLNPVSLSTSKNLDFSNVSTVLHLSALVHQTKKLPDKQYFSVNTEQTISLARKAKNSGVRHFIFYSTVAVYGVHGDFSEHKKLINEKSTCNPRSAYAKSKHDAEKALLSLEDDQFVVSIIRPPLVYGKNAPGNMLRLKKLVKLFPILPFGYANNHRSMVYIDNLTYFTKLVIDKSVSGIFIPQDEDKYSIKEIVKTMAEFSGA